MKTSARSRRHRNPHAHDEQPHQPVFSKANDVPVQTKLSIGQPGDAYEKEADNVANAVVNQSAGAPAVQQKRISSIQRSTLMSPIEDDKLGTAEGRMEKDKMIQEKQEAPVQEPEEKLQTKPEEEEVKMKAEPEEELKMKPKQEEELKMKAEPEEELKMKPEKEEEVKMKAEPEEELKMKPEQEEELKMKEEEEKKVQMKSESGTAASPHLTARLQSAKGGGRPLPGKTRQQMETSIGADFQEVNIHTGADAVEMNQDLHAQAFTHGKDLYFNSGKYNPDSTEGKRLLAHELTHVVQQGGPEVQAKNDPVGQKFTHTAGVKSPYKKITGHYDGQTFTLFGDGGELMSTPAQSGRPYTVTEADAKKCGGNKDDSYMNNPLYVGIRENGPIPEGKFQFSASQMATFDAGDRLKLVTGKHKTFTDPFGSTMHGGDWGPGRVALNPIKIIDAPKGCGDTQKRSGFYLHGGILPGSSGCIDVGNGGLKEVMKHLDGYQGKITISVKYAGGAQKVGWFKRLMGRITYGNPEKKEH